MPGKRPKRTIYIFFAIISIIFSFLTIALIKRSMNPYSLEVIQEQSSNDKYQCTYVYNDFNTDGISEKVTIGNNDKFNQHTIMVTDYTDDVIDQLNFFEQVNLSMDRESILFEDYDSDNFNDVFTLTQAGDSIFLYMHDLRLKKVIINRCFLLKSQPPYLKSDNLIRINGMKLIEINDEEKKVLLFSVSSGRSIKTRGVYLFDIETKKIIKSFEADAYFANVLIYDLTGDGKDEIILTTNAVGNVHYKSEYTDQKCWLFVLDQDLKNIFKPMSFGEYGSELTCDPIQIGAEKYLLLTQRFDGNKNLTDALFFINAKGNILLKKEIEFPNRLPFFKPLIIEKKDGNVKIFTWQGENKIISLDQNLKIVNQISTGFDKIVPYAIKDLDQDGNNEIICLASNNLVILSDKLEMLASIDKPINSKTLISFRENGKHKPIDIGFNGDDEFFLYSFRKNYVYASLPFITAGFSLLLFVALSVIYQILSRIFTFSKYHRFSLVNTDEGALMLDNFGNIKNYNEKAKTIFNLNENLKKNSYFDIILIKYPGLVELIKEGMKSKNVVKETVSFRNGNTTFEGDVCITPIFSKLKIFRNYLVEFQDYNNSVVSSKLVIWSKAAQRMVHDIKYPLSVAAVKLDTLKTRIKSLPIEDDDNINNDFEVINSEIKRVNTIAKSFLKFSELEKPNFQAVSVNDIISNCLKRYEGFINENLKIETAIDEDVEAIWADDQQIELALHNLVENSLDAINGKGFIKISASLAQYLDDGLEERVEFEVADTGPGIDEKIRENIFQAYTTTKTDGTGIGLAIVRKIIEDHGSKIDFYSKPGFGTAVRFAIKVPAKAGN
jgi:nitrogen-specific signal transduction histidine kinase